MDMKLYLISIKVLGDIFVEFDDYENARNLYSFYKKESFSLGLLEETLYSYEALGNVYKFLCKYHKAIKCFKKMIELAWILKNEKMELRAYDHIGIQYFYLGNKDKARYYHERMFYGITEKDESPVKRNVIECYKKRHYHLFNVNNELIIKKDPNCVLEAKYLASLQIYFSKRTEELTLEECDPLQNPEVMKNSFTSDVDMSFQIIFDKRFSDDIYEDDNEKKKNKDEKNNNVNNNKYGKSNVIRDCPINNDIQILSHLSTKRKDYSVERFEMLFKRFEIEFNKYLDEKYKKNNINK